MEFEWDELKEVKNFEKHGISFFNAVETFCDPNGIKLIDRGHSGLEKRFYWIGKDSQGHILTTRYTIRGSRIRIIGCGMWRKYRRYYLEAAKT